MLYEQARVTIRARGNIIIKFSFFKTVRYIYFIISFGDLC